MKQAPITCSRMKVVLALSQFSAVLPRYEVSLEGPKQILKTDTTIEGTVDATYVSISTPRAYVLKSMHVALEILAIKYRLFPDAKHCSKARD